MSGVDIRLDGLLAELVPPPLPAGLAERVRAAAMEAVQEPHAARARRAARPRRDRRGQWMRRPLVTGAVAIGLAFSGAVAATLAGVPLPAKVEAVIAKLPFVGHKAAEPTALPPRRAPGHQAAAARPAPEIETTPPPVVRSPTIQPLRRREAARRFVAARREAGLPTPVADRAERRLARGAERWREASPEQRQHPLDMRRQRIEERRARIEARRVQAPPVADAPALNPQPLAAVRQERIEDRRVDPPIGPPRPRPPLARDSAEQAELARSQRVLDPRQQRPRVFRQQVPRPVAWPRPPVRREGVRRTPR